jgi:hypothetical protein
MIYSGPNRFQSTRPANSTATTNNIEPAIHMGSERITPAPTFQGAP